MSDDESSSGRPQRVAGAFYGRRKTKPLKNAQTILYQKLLPQLLLDIKTPAPKDIHKIFKHQTNQIILEIGFGGGEHMVQRAGEMPEAGFIGCEPFINGMGKALSAIDDAKLTNIWLYDEDATDLLDWLPDNCLDVVYLLYPDPWHKKRHWKRRFANADNLIRFARVLKPGGEFRFASDITHYVNWTLDLCERSVHFDLNTTESADRLVPWEGWRSTRYEQKAYREGRIPTYLTFVKTTD